MKIDFKKTEKRYYNPPKKPEIIDIPRMQFLMIDGKGDPGKDEYLKAIESLYPVAYKLKFMLKSTNNPEYVVPPLEALWWAKDMSAFIDNRRAEWVWTAMIRQPEFITRNHFESAIKEVKNKKSNLSNLDKLRFEEYEEGKVVQMMHIGPYADEGPNIRLIHKYAEEQGFKLRGKHHEIYISDPRKADPKKMKTVIRQPLS